MLIINKLSKNFGNHQVLSDVSFKLEKGKIYGIVGRNGAGKTTLFRSICGLLSSEGTVAYEDQIVKNIIGYLETDPYMLSRITGREYLQLMCNARKIPLHDVDTQNVFELPLDRYASQYSTGMKKKLALLGILLQRNDIFLLDEPFNGVDIQSNLLIYEILDKLRKLNKVVLLSSHIFSSLDQIVDELYYLKEGTLSGPYHKSEFHKVEEDLSSADITEKLNNLRLE